MVDRSQNCASEILPPEWGTLRDRGLQWGHLHPERVSRLQTFLPQFKCDKMCPATTYANEIVCLLLIWWMFRFKGLPGALDSRGAALLTRCARCSGREGVVVVAIVMVMTCGS